MNVKRRRKYEGKQPHLIAFLFSVGLTIIAFAAVGAAHKVNSTFIIILLLLMAIMQVFIQMSFWMHMKDKGHFIPLIGIIGGIIIALTAIITGLYLIWW